MAEAQPYCIEVVLLLQSIFQVDRVLNALPLLTSQGQHFDHSDSERRVCAASTPGMKGTNQGHEHESQQEDGRSYQLLSSLFL